MFKRPISKRVLFASWMLMQLVSLAVYAAAPQVSSIRLNSSPENTRIVFDMTDAVPYEIFSLANPNRLVVDFKTPTWKAKLPKPDNQSSLISGVRAALHDKNKWRVVLDLKQNVNYESFVLPRSQGNPPRLVVDLTAVNKTPVKNVAVPVKEAKPIQEAKKVNTEKPNTASISHSKPKITEASLKGATRDIVVVLDPGHGGKDPGAVGPAGTLEKHLVLSISRQIAERINAKPGFRAVLTRNGDNFLPLRRRMDVARDESADLFMSVHADGFHDARVRGASVFVLSDRGASSELALWLAERENRSDLVGGVALNDKDDVLASVLLDLSQSATMDSSLDVGGSILKQMGRVSRLHKSYVESAGFVVLKSPDIPSVLVEMGFLTNPDEERNLLSRDHQRKISQAIADAVHHYFSKNPPIGTYLALQEPKGMTHTVKSGETLSEIAVRYGVSANAIRSRNQLKTDSIFVGQELAIS